jgi:hypothetical protein
MVPPAQIRAEAEISISRASISAGALAGIALFLLASPALTQDTDAFSIKVESNQILVPVFVLDRYRMDQPYSPPQDVHCLVEYMKNAAKQHPVLEYVPAECGNDEVRGLSTKDFRVFEDGIEQSIQDMTTERWHVVQIRDNLAKHRETSFTSRGIWSSTDLASNWGPPEDLRTYILAYTPPKSSERCHRIQVKVDRHNSYVFARTQYCNFRRSLSDSLNGTEFGRQLESDLTSTHAAKIGISFQTGLFYTQTDRARVQVVLEFPWESLNREWKSGRLYAEIGVLGFINKHESGSLSERFSDFACCSLDLPPWISDPRGHAHPETDPAAIPARYETQIDLPTGEYDLKVVLSDSFKFGRVETALSVDNYNDKQLAISSVMLCKRYHEAIPRSENPLAPDYVPLISKGIEFTPAGDTRFKKKAEPLIA